MQLQNESGVETPVDVVGNEETKLLALHRLTLAQQMHQGIKHSC